MRNLGAVDLATKTAALAGCELLCLPSTSESFGSVFTEAWAFGKPVIGGRIPPVAEVIDEGVDGLLSTQDTDDLARSLLLLLGAPRRPPASARPGGERWRERYGWDRLAERTLAIYRSILDARRDESAVLDVSDVARRACCSRPCSTPAGGEPPRASRHPRESHRPYREGQPLGPAPVGADEAVRPRRGTT